MLTAPRVTRSGHAPAPDDGGGGDGRPPRWPRPSPRRDTRSRWGTGRPGL